MIQHAYSKTINCVALSKGILARQSWILDSTQWILDPGSSSVEFEFLILIVNGIPDFLSCIPDSKAKDSGFSYFGGESRIGHFLVALLDEIIY